MTQSDGQQKFAGRIEGGIDAIVIGADADALAASAYLGNAGLKTILLSASAEIGGAIQPGALRSGLEYVDGEHLLSILDPSMIEDLDLYRFGLKYAARRLETAYFFEDGQTLSLNGDLRQAAQSLEEEEGGQALEKFLKDLFEAAILLRPIFEPGRKKSTAAEKQFGLLASGAARKLNLFSSASCDDVLRGYFSNGKLKTAMMSEAVFRSGVAPHEAYSFLGFVRQKAGEASGLPGAIAYPEGGALGVITALRRATQAAGVDIRASAPVSSILIERDRIAGVELANGGQLRASIVIASGEAQEIFMDMIGPGGIDIEFQRTLPGPAPSLASAQMHLALKGVARDEQTKAHMRRRLVYAPPPDILRRAFNDARAGAIPDQVIIEAIFPDALDEERVLDNHHLLSVMAHPLPFAPAPTPDQREKIEAVIMKTIEIFAPELTARIEEKSLRLPADLSAVTGEKPAEFAAKPALLQQIARARLIASAGHVSGLYYCGSGVQIGAGMSGSAGRVAAKGAIRDYKRGAVA